MERRAAPTIFAVATPPGRSAIAILRISGSRCREVIAALTGSPPPLARRASLRWLRAPATGERLDQALIAFFPAPNSYSGEDIAEIGVHGSRAVISAVVESLAAFPGVRAAEPGEFTRRAFENGKLDLTAAEGVADLIDSETEFQRRQALRIAAGGLKERVDRWRELTLEIAGELESQIDFSDEGDVGDTDVSGVLTRTDILRKEFAEELEAGERNGRLRNGVTVVLAGPPNAGKSTLFNKLIGLERAIVSPRAGTTRDLLHADVDFEGVPTTLIDSAGLRPSSDEVERIGVSRAEQAIENADIVVWLNAVDATGLPARVDGRFIHIWTKADMHPGPTGWLSIDSHSVTDVAEVARALGAKLRGLAGDGGQGVIVRDRHRQALKNCKAACGQMEYHVRVGAVELAAEDCRDVLGGLGRLGGLSNVDDVLDEVFGRFCIGK